VSLIPATLSTKLMAKCLSFDMSGDFGTVFTIHIASMIKTEGLLHCSSGMVVCPVSSVFRMEDITFDLSEIYH